MVMQSRKPRGDIPSKLKRSIYAQLLAKPKLSSLS